MSEPKIYTKNYVSADDIFTVSHGSSASANLYDRDHDSKWVSSGAADDDTTTAATISVKVCIGTLPSVRHDSSERRYTMAAAIGRCVAT